MEPLAPQPDLPQDRPVIGVVGTLHQTFELVGATIYTGEGRGAVDNRGGL